MGNLLNFKSIKSAKEYFYSFFSSSPIRKFFCVLLSLFYSFSCVFCSLTFSNTVVVKRDSLSQRIGAFGEESDNGRLLFNVGLGTKPSASVTADLCSKQYQINSKFYVESLPFVTLSDSQGNFLKTTLSFENGSSFSDYSVATLNTFSNGKRFDSLNIELVKDFQKKTPSLSENLGGIYLPDYLADSLIEQSDFDDLRTYDDLINGNHLFDLSVGGVSFSYKILNVFHVNGFKYASGTEAYQNSDGGSGQIIQSFLGNYIVVTKCPMMSSIGCVLSCIGHSSQFLPKRVFELFFSSYDAGFTSSRFYIVKSGTILENEECRSFSNLYYNKIEIFGGLNAFFLILFIIFIALSLFFLGRYFNLWPLSAPLDSCFSLIPVFLWLVVSQVISSYFCAKIAFAWLLFCNNFGNAFCLLLILLSVGAAFLKKREPHAQ